MLSRDYIDDLLVRFTHHSSAIENNRITLQGAESILIYKMIPSKTSLREVYEIDNHRFAFDYMLSCIWSKEKLTFKTVFKIHSLLLDRLHHERGMFKTSSNRIVGVNFRTASVEETPTLMKQWLDNMNFRLENALSKEEIIKVVCDTHIQFERIHPFQDGNGRVGRMIMCFLLMNNDISPLIIDKDDKGKYFSWLSAENSEVFSSYALQRIATEEQRMHSFK